MSIRQYEIWLADLNPQLGTQAGKTRSVVIVQTNLLNKAGHPSTMVCPLTTNVKENAAILRVHLKKGTANLSKSCDVMIDQIRAIDNRRLTKRIGKLPEELVWKVNENIQIVLGLI